MSTRASQRPITKLAYSLSEFCNAVSLSRSRVYELFEEGKIKPVRCGRKVLISADEAERFIEGLKAA